jgi:hypothetical protein
VREFVERSFDRIGKTIEWRGSGTDEVGVEKSTGIVRVKVSEKYYRPAEVEFLLGDPAKAKKVLKWTPKITFQVGRGPHSCEAQPLPRVVPPSLHPPETPSSVPFPQELVDEMVDADIALMKRDPLA